MAKNWTSKELLYALVGIQSDSFTEMEITISRWIYETIKEQDYWTEHPDLCGLYDGNDIIGRMIPWALRRGTTSKTIVFAGHTDCVEIECYGVLKPYALDPPKLKEELKKLDVKPDVKAALEDPRWEFGRGMADMKGGDAVVLYELFKCARENAFPELNILFMGIPDEEHEAQGIMQSTGLLKKLRDQYGLDYKLLIDPEPTAGGKDKFVYVDGSIGKMLPAIVCRGKAAHVGNIMTGLNSALIAANVERRLDLNVDFCNEEYGRTTTPPTVLWHKDSKGVYQVSVPAYTEIYAHLPMTKSVTIDSLTQKLRELCSEAANDAIATYDRAYEYLNHTQKGNPNYEIKVMTYAELEEICRKTDPDYDAKKAALVERVTEQVRAGEGLIQVESGFQMIEKAIEWSKITDPVIVIGLLPPYVPAVNNHTHDCHRQLWIDRVAYMLKKEYGMDLEVDPYFMGLSDNSYISCTNIEEDIYAMKNMVTPETLYKIPFETIMEISMPAIIIGPAGFDYHEYTERVYMPDVEKRCPAIIETLMSCL